MGKIEKQIWAQKFITEIRQLEATKFDQAMTYFVGHIEPSQINARQEVQSTYTISEIVLFLCIYFYAFLKFWRKLGDHVSNLFGKFGGSFL